ncbi:prolyl 3-hydroxylase OGFOD1-like [Centruroides sculpturatus]|uniref:prolyl 3-hydroxylase OGFOD1-like n=1 Tax=Centruroides sculpturatus TaxID=218467 RepID=UPI000C6D4559|nr:prolyl 3-hydroxylase OGFOD1-like [Centruroides sculpturatus]
MSDSQGSKRPASPSPRESRKKICRSRCKSNPITINPSYLTKEFKSKLKEAYSSKTYMKHGCVEFHSDPFPVCVLPKFINEKESLRRLKEELLDLTYHEKNNDLYTFHQSNDLSNIATRYINWLTKLLYEDFRTLLSEIMGIELNDKMDITCSQYSHGDVLLCHDDELEERRVAFILYLVPAWKEEDGGSLQLFDCDKKSHPGDIVKTFLPVWNNFVFFEVSETSFHQVEEVLSLDKTRLSISGWFHGPPLKRSNPCFLSTYDFVSPEYISETVFRSWINPIYLESNVQMEVQEKFQVDSEIELQDFLQTDKFLEVEKALAANELCWTRKGPANRYNYEQLDADTFPTIVKECIKVFQSEAMFLMLSNLTGLTLHKLIADAQKEIDDASSSNEMAGSSLKEDKKVTSKCCYEIRQWKHGFYTLIHDDDKENVGYALDSLLCFNCNNWKMDYGGFTSYIAKNEDEELLSICPSTNSLALVYRDQDTLRFVKYINSKAKEMPNGFQDIFFIYNE